MCREWIETAIKSIKAELFLLNVVNVLFMICIYICVCGLHECFVVSSLLRSSIDCNVKGASTKLLKLVIDNIKGKETYCFLLWYLQFGNNFFTSKVNFRITVDFKSL